MLACALPGKPVETRAIDRVKGTSLKGLHM